MTAHRPFAAALLLATASGANAQLLMLDSAPTAWAPAAPNVVLLSGASQVVVGHGPVIMVPPNAPPGHLPGRHHPLVRTWMVPVGSFPVVQAPPVAGVSAVAMLPGMPPAPGAQQPCRTVGPSLAPGAFQTGLDVQQARSLAAGTL
jgi:hypothetical protein